MPLLVWRTPVSILMAFLFFFFLLPVCAQEISLLLVSRVSLLCGPLLSGAVALESSLLPRFCVERAFFCGTEGSCSDPFSQSHPWEMPGSLVPTWQILGLHYRPALVPVCISVASWVRGLLQAVPAWVPLMLGG